MAGIATVATTGVRGAFGFGPDACQTMCGICGVIGGDPRQVEPAVRRMMRAMVHRGPDDEGFESFGSEGIDGRRGAGFGFRRLAILDRTQAGHQPMLHSETGDCLIFNGEIYNFRDLRGRLEAEGVRFRGSSDTEVLLQSLVTWGEAALEQVQGMYAIAFYEATRRRVLLARDPLGIKPLYVADLGGRIAFASEVQALLASGIVPTEIDPAGIAGMLAYGSVPAPRTVHASIRSFPGGFSQWINVTAEHHAVAAPRRQFWAFPNHTIEDDAETAARHVEHLLRSSVVRHLVADVPVGILLSAGIDSTIVASFAREHTSRVTAFTIGFQALSLDDEAAVAATTAAELGIKHVCVQVDPTMLCEKWNDWMSGMDSPSVDGFNTFIVSRRLAAEGVVVGLSGLGADELFGGYPCFGLAPRIQRWLACVPRVLRRSLARGVAGLGARQSRAGKLCDVLAAEAGIDDVTRAMRRVVSNRDLRSIGLHASLLGLGEDYLDGAARSPGVPFDGDAFNTVSRVEMTSYMSDTLLRDTDVNTMRHSLEARLPFLDLPLVSYVSALSGKAKVAVGGATKALLRSACPARLSSPVASRTKTGFTLPIGSWMRVSMRDACMADLDALATIPGIHASAVRRVWMRFMVDDRIHWSRPLALVVLGRYLTKLRRLQTVSD